MNKAKKTILVSLSVIALAVAIAGMYKFNYLANQDGYDVDGNKISIYNDNNTVIYPQNQEK